MADLLELLSQAGMVPDQNALAAQQLKAAQQLRGSPMPEGMHIPNGGIYVAPNPMQYASAVIDRLRGGQQSQAAIQQIQQGIQAQGAENRALVERQMNAPAAADTGVLFGQDPEASAAEMQRVRGGVDYANQGAALAALGRSPAAPLLEKQAESASKYYRTLLDHQKQLQEAKRQADMLKDPATRALLGQFYEAGGMQPGEAPSSALAAFAPLAEKAMAAKAAAEARRQAAIEAASARRDTATIMAQARMNSGSNAVGLTPEAIDNAALMYEKTGQLVALGMGAAADKKLIMNRHAEMFPGSDLAANKAGYTSDTASLKKQQQLFDLTKAWETTGKANLAVLKGVSEELVNAGSPLLNRPVRWLYQNAGGDPTVTKFKAAHETVVTEYAKILSGATGAQGVTDSARKEAAAMLPLDSTTSQLAAAAGILEQDAGNRLSALEGQIKSTRERISRTPAKEATPPGGAVRKFTRDATGKLVEVKP